MAILFLNSSNDLEITWEGLQCMRLHIASSFLIPEKTLLKCQHKVGEFIGLVSKIYNDCEPQDLSTYDIITHTKSYKLHYYRLSS